MSKVGKAVNEVTDKTIKAGGVVTKYGGEMLGEIGKTIGFSKSKCNKIERNADSVGKDMYYSGAEIAKKTGKLADKAYSEIKSKFK